MTAPLTALECELLEAVTEAVIEERENALAVLGDYWIENVDEARGAFLHLHLGENRDRIDLADEEVRLAEYTHAWRAPLLAAGYLDRDLVLADGFLQWPLSIPADHPLDGNPDIVRLSPLYYREVDTVRTGAEHTVYEAEAITPRTKRRVAVKAAFSGRQVVLDREIALLSRLAHPNLPHMIGQAVRPPIHAEYDGGSGRALVLDWCGTDLHRLIRAARAANTRLGVELAISVAVQLLDALAAVDRAGIVHMEVRPDHVAVAADGTVTLIDFGYAKAADLPQPGHVISPGRRFDRSRFRYMSPEQVLGRTVDHYTDVYSTAGMIAQLVTNEHQVPIGANDMDTLVNVRDHQQLAPAELHDVFRAPLQRALDRNATRRPTAEELRATLLAGARRIRMDVGPHVIAQRLVELGVPA